MNMIVTCFLFLIVQGVYCQNTEQQSFTIQRYNDSVRVESCIPFHLYNSRVETPSNSNERKEMPVIPIHIIGSKWLNECLIIDWPNISNEEIIGYIKEFTILREDQIILSE